MGKRKKVHKTVLLADSPIGSITMCRNCDTIHINIGFLSIKVHSCSFDELVSMIVCAKSMIEIMKNTKEHITKKKEPEKTIDEYSKYIIYLNEETIMKYGSKEENKEKLEN